MPTTVKDLMAAANAAVPRITPDTARELIARGALVIDVRDGAEVEKTGKVAGALHVTRGMLEFRADPGTPYFEQAFRFDRPVIVYCASGGRAALAGKTLKDMGYAEVFNLGGLKDWIDAKGAVDTPLDPGM